MTEQIDMSRFIEAKSDQLNADDLIGAPRTITVMRVTGNEGDQPIAIHYHGDNGKPFKPCKTIRRVLMGIWGRYANEYVGKSMTLYRDDSVTFGGLQVGGIRISHMSGIEKETTVVVMKSKGKKAGMKILPLVQQRETDKAAEWADAHIQALSNLQDLDALNAHIETGRSAVAKLEATRRDLHAKVTAAYDVRREMLTPAEGRPESDMGEGFNGIDQDEDPFANA